MKDVAVSRADMGDEVVGADVSRKAMGCSKELQSRPVIGGGKVVDGAARCWRGLGFWCRVELAGAQAGSKDDWRIALVVEGGRKQTAASRGGVGGRPKKPGSQ